MTAKELKKLRRSELLEMLLARTEEVERLQAELAEANRKLDDRTILIETSGSIAEASLKLNGVFEAAQAAAEQYLKNIERMTLGDEKIAEENHESVSVAEEASAETKVEESAEDAE